MKGLWNKGLSKMAQDSFLINRISNKCIFETYQDSSLKMSMRLMSSKNLNKKSIFFNYFLRPSNKDSPITIHVFRESREELHIAMT